MPHQGSATAAHLPAVITGDAVIFGEPFVVTLVAVDRDAYAAPGALSVLDRTGGFRFVFTPAAGCPARSAGT